MQCASLRCFGKTFAKMNRFSIATIGFVAGIAGAGVVNLTHLTQPTLEAPQLAPVGPQVWTAHATNHILPLESVPSFNVAANASVDAVVHVKTIERSATAVHPWFEMFGYGAPDRIAQGSGSGVIIDPSGYIVTNNHVVADADEIQVTLNNNRNYPARVIGTDPSTDLAVLQIDAASPLPALAFGNSDEVQIGEWVLAVGNPFDLTSTVTAGIVSAKSRSINILRGDPRTLEYPVESFIQTDAAVNPGNSGGALVNTRGELVGINTAIASRTGSYAGYSFAVPARIVEKVAHDLVTFGEVRRAYLGIQIEPMNEELAEALKLTEVTGCAVVGVVPGSGADDADIRKGDVVVAIDGMAIENFPSLQESVAKYHPGDVVNVEFIRENQTLSLQVQLKNREGAIEEEKVLSASGNTESVWLESCQAEFSPVNSSVSKSLAFSGGMQVTALREGSFSNSGIRKGFIVTKINGKPIENASQIRTFFERSSGGVLVEGVYPNGKKAYYGVAVKE
jgi:serine protease Do